MINFRQSPTNLKLNLISWTLGEDHSIDIESLHKRLYMSLSTPVVRIARACFSNEQFAGVLGQAGCRQYHFN